MTGRIILAISVVGLLACSARAETTLFLKNGRSLSASKIEWREGSQDYMLTSGDTTMPIPRVQVAKVVVDKPADFDSAAGMVRSRLYIQAIPVLEGIVKKYRMLNWDAEAGKLLAVAYLESNDAKKAVVTMDNLFSLVGREQVSVSLQTMYWKALLASGANTQLRNELDKVIGTAAPEVVATAYLLRGNMFLKMGEEEQALSDFIKITTLFQNQKAVQPEALYRAAELLDAARDPRGDEFRKKLIKEYPGTEFSLKSASKPASGSAVVPVSTNASPAKAAPEAASAPAKSAPGAAPAKKP